MTAAAPPPLVDGVPAARQLAPQNTAALAAVLREAPGEAVVFKGAGTKLDWGQAPSRLDTVIDLSKMPREIEHSSGDLVVRVSASVPLAMLNEELARAGQRLAIDEVVAGSTIGGLIATGLSGPLRFGFGTVRDLLIGISVVRADGAPARSGGRVVKNVAGYDLGKLFTGSYGTLGAITEAYFRLHPLPLQRRFLVFSFVDHKSTGAAIRALAASRSAPAAIELSGVGAGPFSVTVMLEGSARSVELRAAGLERDLDLHGAPSSSAPEHYGRLPGRATLKLTFSPGSIAELLLALSPVLERSAGELSGSAAVGLCYLGLGREVPLGPVLQACRAVTARLGGATSVLRAPAEMREGIEVWGSPPAPGLQRALKHSFDPLGRLAPGRFVLGL